MDNFPLSPTTKLPELRYKIGEEPDPSDVQVNKHWIKEYIGIVKEILLPEEFQRIERSFIGPILKICSRKLSMSGKTIHALLCRSLEIDNSNEHWVHFGAQPMRFSMREFHMVTGLKCQVWEPAEGEEVERVVFPWANTEQSHTVEDVVRNLRDTHQDAADERFCLALLILVEALLLQKYKSSKFPASYLKIAQDPDRMTQYHWGREAYKLLMSSIKRNVKNNLQKNKCDLHGFPLAFHLWILESVPAMRTSFSTVNPEEPRTSFLCEKYLNTTSPTIAQVENIEGTSNLNVICILPSIPEDPEESEISKGVEDEKLSLMVELLNKGYKMTANDWRKGELDVAEVLEHVAQQSYRFCNKETGPSSSNAIPSSNELIMERLNKLCSMVEDGFNKIDIRLKNLEEKQGRENVQHKTRIPRQRNPSQSTPSQHFSTDAGIQTPTEEITQKISSTTQMDKDETNVGTQTQEMTQNIDSTVEFDSEPVHDRESDGGGSDDHVNVTQTQENLQDIDSTPEFHDIEGDDGHGDVVDKNDEEENSQPSSTIGKKDRKRAHDADIDVPEKKRKSRKRENVDGIPSHNRVPAKQTNANNELNVDYVDHYMSEEDNQNDEFHLRDGADVEIFSKDDESWYRGTVLISTSLLQFQVQYTNLYTNLGMKKHVEEIVYVDQLRPPRPSPSEDWKGIELFQKVEVYYKNAWRKGTVTDIDQKEFSVEMRSPDITHNFEKESVRIHREWVNGAWDPPLQGDKDCKINEVSRSNPSASGKKLLVLDLNGLLADIIYTCKDKKAGITIINGRAIFKRPFCEDFLKFCFDKFEVGIWSSRKRQNVLDITEYLLGDMKTKLLFCWDMSYCSTTDVGCLDNIRKPVVFKNLNRIWERNPWKMGDYNKSNTVLLDDSPYKALLNPPYTAIFPPPYNHQNKTDSSLGTGGDLRLYLEKLVEAENVQDFIKKNPFGQTAITEASQSWGFYTNVIHKAGF